MCTEPRTPIYFYSRLIRLAFTSYVQATYKLLAAIVTVVMGGFTLNVREKWLIFPNLVPDLESPNQLFKTQFGKNMKYQPFHRINGSVQFLNISGK